MLASYTRWRRYFDAQQQSPGTVLNGADFDTEYDRIKAVFDAVVSAIADVRRDDGGVKNASIGADQLKAEVISLLNGVTPMGTWLTATVYPKGALVRQTNTLYYALLAHTAGVFATDLAAGKWMSISAATGAVGIVNIPAGGISATDVQSALNELDAEKQPIDTTLTAIAGLVGAVDTLAYFNGVDTAALTGFTASARTLLACTTTALMCTAMGALPTAGGTMTGDLILLQNPSVPLGAATKQYVDATNSALTMNTARQTVTAGPVDANGFPSFLPSTSLTLGITAQGITIATPLVAGAANGSSSAGNVDLIGFTATNPVWAGFTASVTNYLYLKVAPGGAMTTGSSPALPPIYQWGGVPAVTLGQYTFNIGEMRGYLGNGATAPQTNLVYVGEAVCSGTAVTSTVAYAYNGQYDSGYTGTLPAAATPVSKNHNLGVPPGRADFRIRCISADAGYATDDEIGLGSLHAYDGANTRCPSLGLGTKTASIISSASTPWIAMNKASGAAGALTGANWKYRITASRGW